MFGSCHIKVVALPSCLTFKWLFPQEIPKARCWPMRTWSQMLQVSSKALRYEAVEGFSGVSLLYFHPANRTSVPPTDVSRSKYWGCQHFLPAFSAHVWKGRAGILLFRIKHWVFILLVFIFTCGISSRLWCTALGPGWDSSRVTSDCCQMTWKPCSPLFFQ